MLYYCYHVLLIYLQLQAERAEQEKASEKLIKEILAQDEKELAAFRVANKVNAASF